MNTKNTIQAFKDILIPFGNKMKEEHPTIKFEYEGDNAQCHTSKKTLKFIKNKLPLPHYPFGGHRVNAKGGRAPNSPDLCVIEYVFSFWEERVLKREPQTVVEMKNIAEEEWQKIPQQWIQNAFKHMCKVYPWVVQHKGEQCKIKL